MDFVIANANHSPFFFLNFMAEYILYFKSIIYSMKEPAQLDIFFSKQNAFPI